jgi:hypothetical protein
VRFEVSCEGRFVEAMRFSHFAGSIARCRSRGIDRACAHADLLVVEAPSIATPRMERAASLPAKRPARDDSAGLSQPGWPGSAKDEAEVQLDDRMARPVPRNAVVMMRVAEQGVARREAIAAAAASKERRGPMPAERATPRRARAEAITMPTPVVAIVPVMPAAATMATMAVVAVLVIPVVMSDSDGTKAKRRLASRIPARSAPTLISET